MLNMISQSHQAVWPSIDTVNFPSTHTLTVCVNLYHRHFHDSVMLLERDSFRLETSPPLVIAAMAAIGAMYSRDGLQRLGIALNELVRRAVFYVVSLPSRLYGLDTDSRCRERATVALCSRLTSSAPSSSRPPLRSSVDPKRLSSKPKHRDQFSFRHASACIFFDPVFQRSSR